MNRRGFFGWMAAVVGYVAGVKEEQGIATAVLPTSGIASEPKTYEWRATNGSSGMLCTPFVLYIGQEIEVTTGKQGFTAKITSVS